MKAQDGVTWREKTRDANVIRMALRFRRGKEPLGEMKRMVGKVVAVATTRKLNSAERT